MKNPTFRKIGSRNLLAAFALAVLIASNSKIQAGTAAPILSNIWNIAADGSAPYVTTGTTERGIAVSRLTGNILICSRAGGTFVKVLDGQTGVLQGDMNTTGISGGTFGISCIRSAD